MPIGDLFSKLGAGEKLTPAEQNELRLRMNNQEALTSQFAAWTDNAGNMDPNIFQLHSRGFSVSPLAGIKLQAGTQSIPDSVVTPVTWGQQFDHGSDFGWSSDAPTQLRTTASRGRDVLFVASLVFASNSSGYRGLSISELSDGSTSIGGNTLMQVSAVSGTETVISGCTIKEIHRDNSAYFTCSALQTCGAALNILYGEFIAFTLW